MDRLFNRPNEVHNDFTGGLNCNTDMKHSNSTINNEGKDAAKTTMHEWVCGNYYCYINHIEDRQYQHNQTVS